MLRDDPSKPTDPSKNTNDKIGTVRCSGTTPPNQPTPPPNQPTPPKKQMTKAEPCDAQGRPLQTNRPPSKPTDPSKKQMTKSGTVRCSGTEAITPATATPQSPQKPSWGYEVIRLRLTPFDSRLRDTLRLTQLKSTQYHSRLRDTLRFPMQLYRMRGSSAIEYIDRQRFRSV